MNQLLNNLQAALGALQAAKPNPTQWSGPAATAFTHRVDLLEIEFTLLCSLLSVASVSSVFNAGGASGAGGFASGGGSGGGLAGIAKGGASLIGSTLNAAPIPGAQSIPFEQLIGQLGLHF
jgi:uncharacterized membrane protein YgcG